MTAPSSLPASFHTEHPGFALSAVHAQPNDVTHASNSVFASSSHWCIERWITCGFFLLVWTQWTVALEADLPKRKMSCVWLQPHSTNVDTKLNRCGAAVGVFESIVQTTESKSDRILAIEAATPTVPGVAGASPGTWPPLSTNLSDAAGSHVPSPGRPDGDRNVLQKIDTNTWYKPPEYEQFSAVLVKFSSRSKSRRSLSVVQKRR